MRKYVTLLIIAGLAACAASVHSIDSRELAVELVGAEEVGVRRRAYRELSARGAEAVPALVEVLPAEGPADTCWAAATLGAIGPAAADAAPALAASLGEGKSIQMGVITRIRALALIGAPAVPALVERLENGDREVRLRAIMAIEWMDPGTDRSAAVPVLVSIYQEEDMEPRLSAARCLEAIGAQAVEYLLEELSYGAR